jgi:hypothetical protein
MDWGRRQSRRLSHAGGFAVSRLKPRPAYIWRDEARRIAVNIARLPGKVASRVLALAQRTPQRYRYVVARTIRFELWQLIV